MLQRIKFCDYFRMCRLERCSCYVSEYLSYLVQLISNCSVSTEKNKLITTTLYIVRKTFTFLVREVLPHQGSAALECSAHNTCLHV